MKIDYPNQEQLTQLRELWQEGFADGDAFLDLFFGSVFSPDRCLCALLENKPVAALYWIDCRLYGKPVAYLYAVTTAGAFRRKGICRQLMRHAQALLKRLGYAGILLVPGNDMLRSMYAAMGFTNATTYGEIRVSAGATPVNLRRLCAQEYSRLRKERLPQGSVIQEGDNLPFLEGAYQLYAGDNVLFAAQEGERRIRLVEFLGQEEALPGIFAALKKEKGTACIPQGNLPFAMWLPLENLAPPKYFAFAFD